MVIPMKKEQFFISTIASDAADTARCSGLGLEIAEYCTAWNMDDCFAETHTCVKQKLAYISHCLFHAPFNELFPCAIDPKARDLAAFRFRQAIQLAKSYNAEKIIIHGGYNPRIYYPIWYTEQSILFWKGFLQQNLGIPIVLENVFEEEPDMLLDIVKEINDPQLRICLDVGHVNAYSRLSPLEWLEKCAPYISHFHIHNNYGDMDSHNGLDMGSIPMKQLLNRADELCPQATFTLEVMQAEPSVLWLQELL